MGRSKESIKSSPDPTVTVTTTAVRASMQQPVCDCEGCEDTTTATAASDWYEKPPDWAEKPARWPENRAVVAATEKAADGCCSSDFGGSSAVDWRCEEARLSVWPVDADKKSNSGSGGGNDYGDDAGGVEGQDGGDGGVEGYDFSRSTEANYEVKVEVENGTFAERFGEARSLLDYSYHSHYTLERQHVQDDILQEALRTKTPGSLENPWAVFTAGAMGAGKSHVMGVLGERGLFPMDAFVQVDPDSLRRKLPEMEGYVRSDPGTAGSLTHKEAGLLAELLEETALLQGRNILVDGSMRNGEWYAEHVGDLRRRFPRLRVAIIHVWAPEEEVMKRAVRRGLTTGRVIPPSVLRDTIRAVPRSVEMLAPLADYCVRIDNVGDDWRRQSQESQQQQNRRPLRQQNNCLVSSDMSEMVLMPASNEEMSEMMVVSSSARLQSSDMPEISRPVGSSLDVPTACTACTGDETRSAAEGGGEGRSRAHSEVPAVIMPVLATSGETWESFRRTFAQDPPPPPPPIGNPHE
ncbi:conserved unknown protein [Ectocarpus siliculosus]|uniref:Zeta toxin domain-containing protein n=1 Tax=Ectocarpus siliculosus TaxID=2880 RepID=D7FLS0_ECTSI|nr:conserved unknown protein [Ectocarpus siliculosus]|eukprot:CBJ29745.1 conserved unknown protein [Ectocarpus siliculosus]